MKNQTHTEKRTQAEEIRYSKVGCKGGVQAEGAHLEDKSAHTPNCATLTACDNTSANATEKQKHSAIGESGRADDKKANVILGERVRNVDPKQSKPTLDNSKSRQSRRTADAAHAAENRSLPSSHSTTKTATEQKTGKQDAGDSDFMSGSGKEASRKTGFKYSASTATAREDNSASARINASHTPGPWESSGIRYSNLCEITVGSSDMHVATVLCIDISEAEAEANARLIAAAPETAAERDKLRIERDQFEVMYKDELTWFGDLEKAHNEMMLDRDSLARQRDQLREACQFLMSQVEQLANVYMSGETRQWLAKNDAMNCGRRAIKNTEGKQ